MMARVDTEDRHSVMMRSPRPREATEKCHACMSEAGDGDMNHGDGHGPLQFKLQC